MQESLNVNENDPIEMIFPRRSFNNNNNNNIFHKTLLDTLNLTILRIINETISNIRNFKLYIRN